MPEQYITHKIFLIIIFAVINFVFTLYFVANPKSTFINSMCEETKSSLPLPFRDS